MWLVHCWTCEREGSYGTRRMTPSLNKLRDKPSMGYSKDSPQMNVVIDSHSSPLCNTFNISLKPTIDHIANTDLLKHHKCNLQQCMLSFPTTNVVIKCWCTYFRKHFISQKSRSYNFQKRNGKSRCYQESISITSRNWKRAISCREFMTYDKHPWCWPLGKSPYNISLKFIGGIPWSLSSHFVWASCEFRSCNTFPVRYKRRKVP